jgi:hypothetical protein
MPAEVPGGGAAWLDDDAGPMVRSYALTGGRTRGRADLDLLTHVVTTEAGMHAGELLPEQRAIVGHALRPKSVAEIASHVDLPVGVVRVLLGDLLDAGVIAIEAPPSVRLLPDDHVLRAVIDGLRSL